MESYKVGLDQKTRPVLIRFPDCAKGLFPLNTMLEHWNGLLYSPLNRIVEIAQQIGPQFHSFKISNSICLHCAGIEPQSP